MMALLLLDRLRSLALFISLVYSQSGFIAASPALCTQHRTRSECLVFRNQHGCVWHVPGQACVPDVPCEERARDQCHAELTTGISASWDTSANKCFWDDVRLKCRWSDECTRQRTEEACTIAACAWETMCTPSDMRSLPGPGRCSEVCVVAGAKAAPESHQEEGPNVSSARLAASSSQLRHVDSLTDVVLTSSGYVQGIDSGNVQKFLGIPFAQAPVGELRWAPPQPLARWKGVFNATSYGPSCTQARGYYFKDPSLCQGYARGDCLGYTEDCLNLNIWTPSLSGSKAVMVWIHGGCFVSGSASNSAYDGAALAAEHDVVLVTIQYRLAAFGFLGDELLRPRDPSGSTGNYGLMDNIAALRWIQANIASFGGDPGSVTIFGESSGAGSVSQLLGVEAAWPYFHKAIMESGTASFWTYMDIDAAYTNFQKVLTGTGCSHSADKMSCLLQASSILVSSAVSSVPCRDGCNWAPVVDGVFVKGRTLQLAKASQLRPKTQIIAGFNLNDGAMFVPGYPSVMSTMSGSKLDSYYATRFGIERTAALQSLFPVQKAIAPSWLSHYFYSAQECETDFSYACTAQSLSSITAFQGSTTYVYQFSEPSSNGLVLHGDEIGYVFGTLTAPSPLQRQVMTTMMRYWSNFAKTGDPNGNGLPSWPAWNQSAPLLNISAKSTVAFVPNHSFRGCSFFDANWDYYGGCLPAVSDTETPRSRNGSDLDSGRSVSFVV